MENKICKVCNKELPYYHYELIGPKEWFNKATQTWVIKKDYRKRTCKSCQYGRPIIPKQERVNVEPARYKTHSKEYQNEANRKRYLKMHYGLTPKEVDMMLEKVEYKCEICKKSFKDNGKYNIDHCHSTNKVRGILCTKCNTGLGQFEDNTENMYKAIEYLLKHQEVIKLNQESK